MVADLINEFNKQQKMQYQDINKINSELSQSRSRSKAAFDLDDDLNALQDLDSEPKSARYNKTINSKKQKDELDFDSDDLMDLLN